MNDAIAFRFRRLSARCGRLLFCGQHGRGVLDPAALHSLARAIRAAASSGCSLMTLESRLPRLFAAGADLRHLARLTADEADGLAGLGQRTFGALRRLPAVTVALVDGAAMGGGLDLALTCDVRLATPAARFGHPGARLGIVTTWGGTARLPRLIGLESARQIFYTGDPVTAEWALDHGLVDAVAPLDRLRLLARQLDDSDPGRLRRRLRRAGSKQDCRRRLLELSPRG